MKTAKDFAQQALRLARRAARWAPVTTAECGAAFFDGIQECCDDRAHGFPVDTIEAARRMAIGAARATRHARFGNKRGLSPVGAREIVLLAYHNAGFAQGVKPPRSTHEHHHTPPTTA